MSLSPHSRHSTILNSYRKSQESNRIYESIEDHIRKNNNEIVLMEEGQRKMKYQELSDQEDLDEHSHRLLKHNIQRNSSNIISLTQRDIVNLIDRCPQLMREDKLFLRNRVKNYFKDLAILKNEDRFTYEGAIQSDYDISDLIQILAECKKPIDKIHLYEKHMHWLQVRLRKYVNFLHKKKKQECLQQFKKTKRLVTHHNDLNNHQPTIVPKSTKKTNENSVSSSGFYKRFKQQSNTPLNRKQNNIRNPSNLSQEKNKKNQCKKVEERKQLIRKTDENKSVSMKSSLRGNKVEKTLSRPTSRNQRRTQSSLQRNHRDIRPQTCKNKSASKILQGWKSSLNKNPNNSKLAKPPIQQKPKQQKSNPKAETNKKSNCYDIDDLSQINKKSSIPDREDQNYHNSVFGTSDRPKKTNQNQQTYKKQNTCQQKVGTLGEEKEGQHHICSLIQKQVYQVSQWSRKLTTGEIQNQPKSPQFPSQQQKQQKEGELDLSSKIQSIKIANKKIDELLASSRKLVNHIQSRNSPQVMLSPEANKRPIKSDDQQLFTSPEILAQCRMFINSAHVEPIMEKIQSVSMLPQQSKQEYRQNDNNSSGFPIDSPNFSYLQFHHHNFSPKLQKASHQPKFFQIKDILVQIFQHGCSSTLTEPQVTQLLHQCRQQIRQPVKNLLFPKSSISYQVEFTEILPKILQILKSQNQELTSRNIFQILDLDNKGYVEIEDFQVFIENLRISEVQEALLSQIQSILDKIKQKLLIYIPHKNNPQIQIHNFYHLELIHRDLIIELCEVLEPFQFQINAPEN